MGIFKTHAIARLLLLACLLSLLTTVRAADLSVAFYYGATPPLTDLAAFDIAVVEPEHVARPQDHVRPARDGAHELFAYISLGEVHKSRPYYARLPAGALRAENQAWGSGVIDQAAPGWREFFLSEIVAPLWQQGWRGFFIDTLDAYQQFSSTDAQRAVQREALVATLREFKRRYPEARLILNRGFELLPELAPLTFAVAAESLYQGYDAASGRYRPVPQADRDWLLAQMETVRERYRLPVISIEYVAPGGSAARTLARTTARQVREHGFIAWVADGALSSLGVGTVEVVPRTVLILVDNLQQDLYYTEAQRFIGMPLNYLGLRYEFVDLKTQALPAGVLDGQYAGIVTWLNSGAAHPGLADWILRRISEGMPIAVFDVFGFTLDNQNLGALGLQKAGAARPGPLSIIRRDPVLLDFEATALPDRAQLEPIRLLPSRGRSLLQMADSGGNIFDAVALTSWGGFALAPFTVRSLPTLNQDRWIVEPIKFLQAALQLPALPVPDVTTEGGRRILMAHVDGDGFASRAELPGAPFSGAVLGAEILTRYQLPTAVSVIEAEISTKGVYPQLSSKLEPLARKLLAMPSVEAASHSYSHPFSWAKAMHIGTAANDDDGIRAGYGLPLPGYQFDLQREIRGSIDFINSKLLPANKKAQLFLWTGNCVPPPKAIAETYASGLLNMNGGDTTITESNRTWTAIASNGVRKNGWYQVFAPNQNENVYTGNWTGPFYGYERVQETFRLTGEPYRFKPVDIYYHFYSATKVASLAALHKVYGWALTQPFTRIFPSQYVQKVLDFESTTMSRELVSGDLLVRTGTSLRTLRLPPDGMIPTLAASTGVAGIAPGPGGSYLTLAAAQVRLSYQKQVPPVVAVREVNGSLDGWSRTVSASGQQLDFVVRANDRIGFTLDHAAACIVTADGKTLPANRRAGQAGQTYVVDRAVAGTLQQQSSITVRCAA